MEEHSFDFCLDGYYDIMNVVYGRKWKVNMPQRYFEEQLFQFYLMYCIVEKPAPLFS